ncbi:MAG: class I SAM-dependent methyltransferase [Caulobacteraceae bacterium]|nr:class I SAM-dependent methyltransferase [Caulobacteraceae bacterium]
MPTVLNDAKLDALLARLHGESIDQEAAIERYYFHERTGAWTGMEPRDVAFMADKLEALDKDKAEFCYMICRAIGARRIVEAGTSFGVSTLYLAAAVRDNGGGTVFAAEREPTKVAIARANYAAAGLTQFIELHEADVTLACRDFAGPIDFVLFDIWTDAVRPVLDVVLPRLRPGAIICADNTGSERARTTYGAMFEILEDPHAFRTMTLPFKGGLEMAVKL